MKEHVSGFPDDRQEVEKGRDILIDKIREFIVEQEVLVGQQLSGDGQKLVDFNNYHKDLYTVVFGADEKNPEITRLLEEATTEERKKVVHDFLVLVSTQFRLRDFEELDDGPHVFQFSETQPTPYNRKHFRSLNFKDHVHTALFADQHSLRSWDSGRKRIQDDLEYYFQRYEDLWMFTGRQIQDKKQLQVCYSFFESIQDLELSKVEIQELIDFFYEVKSPYLIEGLCVLLQHDPKRKLIAVEYLTSVAQLPGVDTGAALALLYALQTYNAQTGMDPGEEAIENMDELLRVVDEIERYIQESFDVEIQEEWETASQIKSHLLSKMIQKMTTSELKNHEVRSVFVRNNKMEMSVFAALFKVLKEKGDLRSEDFSLFKNVSVNYESAPLPSNMAEDIRAMHTHNTEQYPEVLREYARASLENALEHNNPDEMFVVVRLKDDVISTMRVLEQEDGSLFGSSFNVNPSVRGARIGTELLKQVIRTMAQKKPFVAHCFADNKILDVYVNDFGFQVTDTYEDYHGTGAKVYEITRFPDQAVAETIVDQK